MNFNKSLLVFHYFLIKLLPKLLLQYTHTHFKSNKIADSQACTFIRRTKFLLKETSILPSISSMFSKHCCTNLEGFNFLLILCVSASSHGGMREVWKQFPGVSYLPLCGYQWSYSGFWAWVANAFISWAITS